MWLGTYESDYPRNRVLIDGLRELGVEVVECHAPVWERERHKAGGFLAPRRLAARAGRLASAWVRVLASQARVGRIDAVVLGYPSQPDGPIGWAVAKAHRAPLVVDAMIAVSDALGDRDVARAAHRALRVADRIAFGAADVVIADTGANAAWLEEEEQRQSDQRVHQQGVHGNSAHAGCLPARGFEQCAATSRR